MLLQPKTTFCWPPRTAARIYVSVLGEDATKLLLDGTPVELRAGGRKALAVSGAGETTLANLGPGLVELTWATGTADPLTDPARTHGRLADPLRDLVSQAWAKAFDETPGNPFFLPHELRRYDPSTLPDVPNIGLDRGFTTMCPGWDNGSAWGDGNARTDLTALVLDGLRHAKYTVPPKFSDADRKIVFEFRLPSFDLAGKCTLHQRCCHGVLGWCWSSSEYSGWNNFKLAMQETYLSFDAMTVDAPGGQLTVSVTDTRVDIRGSRTMTFPSSGGLPDWLNFLRTDWARIAEFKNATESASVQALRGPGIRGVLQSVVNDWIDALRPAAARGGERPAHV